MPSASPIPVGAGIRRAPGAPVPRHAASLAGSRESAAPAVVATTSSSGEVYTLGKTAGRRGGICIRPPDALCCTAAEIWAAGWDYRSGGLRRIRGGIGTGWTACCLCFGMFYDAHASREGSGLKWRGPSGTTRCLSAAHVSLWRIFEARRPKMDWARFRRLKQGMCTWMVLASGPRLYRNNC